MIEEPEQKPLCKVCGSVSIWVCHSVNLHYFYCKKCKLEVPKADWMDLGTLGVKSLDGWYKQY